MIIITDNKEYSEQIFTSIPNWIRYKKSSYPQALIKITDKFFRSSNLFQTEIESDPIWKYAFVVNHAQSSQFTSLIELSRDECDLPGGILCFARSGDNFKGYRSRSWVSLSGNIHLSAYIKPNQVVDYFHIGFTILSAISVIQSIDKIPNMEKRSQIKWVNDILIDDGKVSGVLTQTQTKANKVTDLFIGIGINVNVIPKLESDFIVKKATSINANLPDSQKTTQGLIAKNLIHALSKNYSLLLKGQYNKILDLYRERSKIIGKKIEVYSDPMQGKPEKNNEGKVVSIGKNLELYLEGKEEPVVKGRIILV
ncbi:MAG: biotin--[acetyl-CoA-carboxylase] ligase [Calditrichaeota bacterium]|nr:MAG: biotin--[acetyl-CoA-carboxylase] ligase [Calditrichota bacterium]MBL1203834.1 biotin--[acetyl-CoA-carboxylase] ligase [Calditrichota bacterium]NOG43665.1 biotin--[acetyl-CoA-carboxylase] ligase [Calditrichota bacterium]